jgi:hypothetical protein
MSDFLIGLMIFVLVTLTLITVGHLLWLFLAFVFRGFQPKKTYRHACGYCGRQTAIDNDECHWCGKEQNSPLAQELRDLEAIRRQLNRFQRNGDLPPKTIADLLLRISRYRERLLSPHQAAGKAVQPQRAAEVRPVVQKPPVIETTPVEPPLKLRPPVAKLVTDPRENCDTAELINVESVEEPKRPLPVVFAKEKTAEEKPKPQSLEPAAKNRVEEFLAKKTPAAPPQRPVLPPTPPPPPRPPRKTFGETMGAFLAERDIRWTELIFVLLGGLLMVGSSVMLVVANWSKLASNQALQFSVFVGYSSIVFAAGLFTYYRWKLQSTGRGLMAIGILLAPLNFLAMAGSQGTLPMLLVETLALGVFAALVAIAGKTLTRGGQIPLTASVIGHSALLLAVGQFLRDVSSPWVWMGFASAISALFAVTTLWHLRQVGGAIVGNGGCVGINESSDKSEKTTSPMLAAVNSLFILLGVAVYTTAMCLIFLGIRASHAETLQISSVLPLLAGPLCLASIPVLLIGLHLHRCIPCGANAEGQRTAGTTTALVGAVLQLASLALAWPQPLLIAAVGILAAGCLVYLALRYDFPAVHAGAMFAAGAAYLAVFFVIRDEKLRGMMGGNLLLASGELGSTLLKLFVDAKCGTALGGLFFVYALISELFARKGHNNHGMIYAAGSCVVAALGLMLVTFHGFYGDADEILANGIRAAALYALYGAVGVLLSLRWNKNLLSYLGWNLLAIAPFWLLKAIPLEDVNHAFALAGCLLWASGAWFALAWRHRSAAMLAFQQILLYVAGLSAVFGLLVQQGWLAFDKLPDDLFKAYNLQAFGVALAAISLGWMVVRLMTQKQERIRTLLEPAWLPVDKIMVAALVVLQAFVIVPFIFGGIRHEIVPTGTASNLADYCGPTAWIFMGILAATHVLALANRWDRSHLIGSIILATSVPCLVAGYFSNQAANASALRWGFAVMYLVLSVAIWCRKSLVRHVSTQLQGNESILACIVAGCLTVVPVVGITVYMAAAQLSGFTPSGPTSGMFRAMGPSVSYLVPLMLIVVGLVGHALRESSALNAFFGGLVVELAVFLGYPLYLSTSTPPKSFGSSEFMVWIQLMTIAAAVWAIGWLVARRWVNVWREEKTENSSVALPTNAVGMKPKLASTLMNFQIGFGFLGNILLLGLALLEIVFHVHAPSATSLKFVAAEGMPLGWIALALTVAAGGYRAWQRGDQLRPHGVGLTGMSVLALLACTIPNLPLPNGAMSEGYWPYRVLMVGWACYALLVALATWWVAEQRTLPDAKGPPQALVRLAAVWVRVAGIAAVLLGLKAGFWHDDIDAERLWAAAGIAIAAMAGASMAVWRRREGWAFCAATGVNLAASLAVWHFEGLALFSFDQWWVRLVQANLIASSSVALVWMAAHRKLYELRDWGVRQSPLLALQLALPVVVQAAMLFAPLVALLVDPRGLPKEMTGFADAPGWVAIALLSAAGAWYLRRALPGQWLHAIGGLGLGVGVLIACGVEHLGPYFEGNFAAYRMLYAVCTAVAVLLFAISFAASGRWMPLPASWNFARHFSGEPAKMWISSLVVFSAVLVGRACYLDTEGLRWSLSSVAFSMLVLGAIAVWRRSVEHVFVAGLMFNLASVVIWFTLPGRNETNFFALQTLGLAASAGLTTLTQIARPGCLPCIKTEITRNKVLPFSLLAIAGAILFLAIPTVFGVLGELAGNEWAAVDRLAWIALASVAGVLVLSLWDRLAGFSWLGLYFSGLIAVGMLLLHHPLPSDMIFWRMGSEFTGYALVTALIGRFLPWCRPVCRYLLVPDGENRWSSGWFMPLQAVLTMMVALLCIWISIDFRFDGVGKEIALFGMAGRLAGMTGLLMVLGTTIMMAAQTRFTVRQVWQSAAFVVGMLFLASIRWAAFDAANADINSVVWLHRGIALLFAAASIYLTALVGLPQVSQHFWSRFFPESPSEAKSTWCDIGKKMLPYFAGIVICLLAFVMVYEGAIADDSTPSPVSLFEMFSVVGIVLTIFAMLLVYALKPDLDPLKLNDRGRQAYVYAAEACLAIIWLHIRLTHPDIFHLEIMKQYWMLIFMGIAFAIAFLSEIFHRWKMPVLSQPLERTALLLPLLPVVGFWIMKGEISFDLKFRTPWVWLFISVFYGMMSYMRRSGVLGILAIVAGNVGLWVTLHRGRLDFIDYPQLWLIPIALCALAAEFMNRRRLTKSQATGIRYAALCVIYLSTTADMFHWGIGEGFWRPMTLLLLAVIGALAGVVFKIRSFLILGITFLVIDIISLIYYANVDLGLTWIKWICMMLLGLSIIITYGFIEKRRNDIKSTVEKFKKWER